jgi:hypothetical protein
MASIAILKFKRLYIRKEENGNGSFSTLNFLQFLKPFFLNTSDLGIKTIPSGPLQQVPLSNFLSFAKIRGQGYPFENVYSNTQNCHNILVPPMGTIFFVVSKRSKKIQNG